MKTYLVTGGAGFIGANFIIYMLEKYRDIRIINADALTYAANLSYLDWVANDERYFFEKCDITDRNAVEALFEKYDIDYVVNFAAESHVDRSIENANVFVKTNVGGTFNLLDSAKINWQTGDDEYKKGVKFLQISTDEVYGSIENDGFFTEQSPIAPSSPYSASKASADLLVLSYAHTYKLPVNITRCSNNYGAFQFPEKLIPLMFVNAVKGKSLPVYGDGKQVRDWIYVRDHCSAIDAVLHSSPVGEVYNVGAHCEMANIDIVKMIIDFVRENINPKIDYSLIEHVEDRKGHDRRYAIDNTKIRSQLGWKPQTSFEIGLKKTLEWYAEKIKTTEKTHL